MTWSEFFKALAVAIEDFIVALYHDPLETKPRELPMNIEPEAPQTPKIEITATPAPSELLCATAKRYIGKDASPKDLAPQELSCAECVVNIINETWPGTLNTNIVSTDELFKALQRSRRFKGVLDPKPGCVEVSPRTATVNGHVGIYVAPDQIASNDSRDGIFRANYTRQLWRNVFIKGRGLKAYIFLPVDN